MSSQEPVADRPSMPGYGIAAADEGEGLLPWSWAEQRLADAVRYWLATATLDGSVHLAPVWGVWSDGALWFSTGAASRKARNIAADPHVSVGADVGDEQVVLSGAAEPVSGAWPREEYARKYGEAPPPGEPVFRVKPHRVLGFVERPEGRFTATATRWTFPPA